jgi:hypothetical protein
VDQLRAFRMSLREKPTVSQTAPLRLTTQSYTCGVQAAGTKAAIQVRLAENCPDTYPEQGDLRAITRSATTAANRAKSAI